MIARKNIENLSLWFFFVYTFACLVSRTLTGVIEFLGIILLFHPSVYKSIPILLKKESSYRWWLVFSLFVLTVSSIHFFLGNNSFSDLTRLRHYIFLFSLGAVFLTYENKEKRSLQDIYKYLLYAIGLGILVGNLKTIYDITNLVLSSQANEIFQTRFRSFTGINSFTYCIAGFSCFFFIPFYRSIQNKKVNYFLVASSLLAFFALFFAQSRGPFLIFGLMASFSLFFVDRKKAIGVSLFCLLILTYVVNLSIGGGSSKSRLFQSKKSSSNMMRLSQYQTGLYMIKDNPVLGVGIRNVRRLNKEYKEKYNLSYPKFTSHVHNTFIHIASAFGIFSLALFFVFLFSLFRDCLHFNNKLLKGISLGLILTFLIQSLWDHMYIRQYAVCFNVVVLFIWLARSFNLKENQEILNS